jgi:hypothetical protein
VRNEHTHTHTHTHTHARTHAHTHTRTHAHQGSKTLNGIYVGPDWNSEITIVNTRIFGHNRSGVVIAGGAHALVSNNLIGDNSIAGMGLYPGVSVASGVSDFIFTSNHIGAIFRGQQSSAQKAGESMDSCFPLLSGW